MSATTSHDTIRNATLDDMFALLQDQQTRKLDMVVPAARMRAERSELVLEGMEPHVELTEEGVNVTEVDGRFTPTDVFDEGIASRLGIPTGYLRRLRNEAPDLYDANVNGWLHGSDTYEGRAADARSFYVRTFRGRDGEQGVARAVASDRYKAIDNIDVLTAVFTGIHNSGQEVTVHSSDLTDRKMLVRLHSPAIAVAAPDFLRNYRNPFADPELDAQRQFSWNQGSGFGYGYDPGTEPVVFAGVRISNSEVGNGAFSIVPELRVKICSNGLVISADLARNVHLGGKLEAGVVEWSEATQRKALELITAKTGDLMTSWLSEDYVKGVVARIEALAGKPVENPETTIKAVASTLKFSEAETMGIMGHFIRGGQMTAGGVLNAVTSFTQTVADADRADAIDRDAMRVLTLV